MTSTYRVRIAGGEFFTIHDGGGCMEEVCTLAGAIESAEEFLADTEHAHRNGFLDKAYGADELEIVSTDGAVLSLAQVKALLAVESAKSPE